MRTLKITSTLNGVVTSVREIPMSDDAFERFSLKIKEMRDKKEEALSRLRNRITPELIEKVKQMNQPRSPG